MSDEEQKDLQQAEDGATESKATGPYAEEIDKFREGESFKVTLKGQNKAGRGFGYFKRKKFAIAAGSVGFISMLIISAIFFLLPFKLEFFFQNIDAATFANYNAFFEARSSKWIQAYSKARLMEIEGGNPARDNIYFRSERVDRNKPFTDWYRTMRTSSFESNLLRKQGIAFTSFASQNSDGSINIRQSGVASIQFGDEDIVRINALENKDVSSFRNELQKAMQNGDFTKVDEILDTKNLGDRITIEHFEGDINSRRLINSKVSSEVPWYRVIKRKNLRANIRNELGVRKWRFFERTRNNIRNAKSRFQVKLLQATFGTMNGTGKFISCLFGGACPRTSDNVDPDNRANRTFSGEKVDDAVDPLDEDGADAGRGEIDTRGQESRSSATKSVSDLVDPPDDLPIPNPLDPDSADTVAVAGLKRFLASNTFRVALGIGAGIGFLTLADTLTSFHFNVVEGKFTDLLALQRLAAAGTVYTTYGTIKDQINSGEDLDSEEVGAALASLNGFAASEGYQSLVLNRPVDPEAKEAACGNEELRAADENFPYRCDDEKFGEDTRLADFKRSYENGFGKIIEPIAKAYRGATSLPIIGDIVGFAIDLFNKVGDAITGFFLKITGLEDDAQRAVTALAEKAGAYFGFGPLIDGSEGGARIANHIIAGGTGIAENALRVAGAQTATGNPALEQYSRNLAKEYKQEQLKNMSWSERWFGTSNPYSLTNRFALAIPDNVGGIFSSLKFNGFSSFINSIFSPLFAADETQTPQEFTGIEAHGFSEEALNMDPGEMSLNDCTNADTVLGLPLNWDLVQDPEAFWAAVYSNADDKAKGDDEKLENLTSKIWNICIMDAQIMNGFTSPYTDEDDGGLGLAPIDTVPPNLRSDLPPNFDPTDVRQGYYHLPDAPNGEYEKPFAKAVYYGSQELIAAIYTASKNYKAKYPNSRVIVTDLNDAGHSTHLHGRSVDIYAIGNPCAANYLSGSCPENYDTEATIDFGKMFVDTGVVHRIIWCEPGSSFDLGRSGNDGSMQAITSYAQSAGKPLNQDYVRLDSNGVYCVSNHRHHFHVDVSPKYGGQEWTGPKAS